MSAPPPHYGLHSHIVFFTIHKQITYLLCIKIQKENVHDLFSICCVCFFVCFFKSCIDLRRENMFNFEYKLRNILLNNFWR